MRAIDTLIELTAVIIVAMINPTYAPRDRSLSTSPFLSSKIYPNYCGNPTDEQCFCSNSLESFQSLDILHIHSHNTRLHYTFD